MSITHTERYTYEQRVAQAANRLITMEQCGVGRYKMNLQSIAMVFCVKEADIVNAASILRDHK